MDVKFFLSAAKLKWVLGETLNSCSFLSHAPGSTKTSKFEEKVEIFKLQRSVSDCLCMTLTEGLE